MKYCDKWVVSNTEPKADALWVQPIKEQKDSINVKAFVDGRWKSAGGGFTVPEGGIPLKDLDKSTQEAIDPTMASYNEYSKQYFTTEYVNDKRGAIYFKSNVSSAYLEEISYSINGGEWVTVKNGVEDDDDGGLDHIDHRDIKSAPDINVLIEKLKNPTPSGKKGFEIVGFDIEIPVESGDIIRWKGKGIALAQSLNMGDDLIYSYFDCVGYYKVYGNVSSLLYGDDFENEKEDTTPFKYAGLFASTLLTGGSSKLVDASNLILPSKVSMGECIMMFGGCAYLVKAPILPATTLATGCYVGMFSECEALISAPKLPATTLASECYNSMFYSCISLTAAPELPEANLATGCYNAMFRNCTSLNYIKFLSLPENPSYIQSWTEDVLPGGTLIVNDVINDLDDIGFIIPTGWAVYRESDRMDEPVKKYEHGNVIEIYPEGDEIYVGANSSYIVMDQPTGEFTIHLPPLNPQKEEKINIALVTGDTTPSISFEFTDASGMSSPALIEYDATFETSSTYLIECISVGRFWFVKWKKYILG